MERQKGNGHFAQESRRSDRAISLEVTIVTLTYKFDNILKN